MNMINFVLLVISTLVCVISAVTIPDGLSLGAATAAYQIEGAWDEDGKGESIWDHMVHYKSDLIANGSTGDISADSYHKYKEDVQALVDMGMNHYRFSISWPRILPTGDITNVNQKGIDYYNAVIDELLANNIEPLVTIYHWDLPQSLQDLGGWVNPIMIDYFEDYARILFTEFGDRVKLWLTFNEPEAFVSGYGSSNRQAPAVNASGVGDFLAAHTVLKAHARVYHLYDDEFRAQQNGKVSIVLTSNFVFPKTDSDSDRMAAERALQFEMGWFAHPIHSEEGDYPAVMKEVIGNLSKAEGRYRSRLPEFDEYWVNYIKGTADFFGLNNYRSGYATSTDEGYGYVVDFLDFNAAGFRGLLTWISKEYHYPDIFVTENGFGSLGTSSPESLNDTDRIDFFNDYLSEMLNAINTDNCSVIGYTVWGLIDDFEWSGGYSYEFGLYDVDFNDPDRPRTAKASSKAWAKITSTREIPVSYP